MTKKVTMNLTDWDVENADVILESTQARSKAHAVSSALSLTRFLIDELKQRPGTEVLLRNPDGSQMRLVVPELEQLSKTGQSGR